MHAKQEAKRVKKTSVYKQWEGNRKKKNWKRWSSCMQKQNGVNKLSNILNSKQKGLKSFLYMKPSEKFLYVKENKEKRVTK